MGKLQTQWLLLLSVLVIATCGLVYELVAGTLASYLLGDSVTQFSIIIGVYLFSMGIGSYFSKFFTGNLIRWFIHIEILVGVIGGFSSTILFLCFEWVISFRLILYSLISVTGILVGLEIPLLMRILNEMKEDFKDIVSRVFTFDYLGALLASIIFPLLLIPHLGLIRTSLLFGIMNVIVAIILSFKLHDSTLKLTRQKISSILSLIILIIGFIFGERIMKIAETASYEDKIIYSKSSKYQRIVLTKNQQELKLFLNGNLQFNSKDEYRYHEALVHPVMTNALNPERILILGGGDGLAVREVLKYDNVKEIILVDLDPALTNLFIDNEILKSLNNNSLSNQKLELINEDAFVWITKSQKKFDVIIIDFPDPSNFSLGKLYSNLFYKNIYKSLEENGAMVVQSTSPLYAPKSFWCIDNTIRDAHLFTVPYHCYVPSFGEWGFVMAKKNNVFSEVNKLPDNLRYFTSKTFDNMKYFTPDMAKCETEVNRLNKQSLVNYFEEEWGNINH